MRIITELRVQRYIVFLNPPNFWGTFFAFGLIFCKIPQTQQGVCGIFTYYRYLLSLKIHVVEGIAEILGFVLFLDGYRFATQFFGQFLG